MSHNLKPAGCPVLRYALRRMVAAVVLAVILSVGIFLAMSLLPGDIPTTILGKNATPPQVGRDQQEYHLNEPLPKRYATVGRVLHGDLGTRSPTGSRCRKVVLRAAPTRFSSR